MIVFNCLAVDYINFMYTYTKTKLHGSSEIIIHDKQYHFNMYNRLLLA